MCLTRLKYVIIPIDLLYFSAIIVMIFVVAITFQTLPLIITVYQRYAKGVTVYLFPINLYYFCEDKKSFYSYLLAYCFAGFPCKYLAQKCIIKILRFF